MEKRTRKITGKYAKVTDKDLQLTLQREYEETPENFFSSVNEAVPDSSHEILVKTAGRAIEPIRKWL